MRTIINTAKYCSFIFFLLITFLSVQQSVGQSIPKIITATQYSKLSPHQQVDTGRYYIKLYCNFPGAFPGQKLPPDFTLLIKKIIGESPVLLSNSSISKKEKVKIYLGLAAIHWTTAFSNIDSLLYYTDIGLKASQEDSSLWKSSCYFLTLKGQAYQLVLNDFVKSFDIGKKLLSISLPHNDTTYMGCAYLIMAQAYYNSPDSSLPVEEYCFKAAQLFKNNNPPFYNTSILDAIQFLIGIYQAHGSNFSLQKAKQLHVELTEYNQQHKYRPVNFNFYTASAYFALFDKDTIAFLHYADTVKSMTGGVGGWGDWQQGSSLLLYAHFLSKDYQKFITAIHNNFILSNKSLFPKERLDLLNMMSTSFAALKQYDSAYLYKKEYSEFRDSVVFEKNALEMNALNKRYNVAQKQHEIDTLETQKKQNEITGLIIGLILLLGISIVYTRMRIKAKKMQQQIAQLDMATQYHIYELEEKEKSVKAAERKRLGMELHDGLSGTLAAIKYKTELITPDKPAEQLKKELADITGLLNEAYSAARNKSHDLFKASEAQEDFSFSERVRLILKNTLPANIQHKEITIDDISLKQIPVKVKVELLQIIKESVTNILKHAKANSISLLLYGEMDEVLLTIIDDGKGFDTTAPFFKRGVGLNSIYQRVEDIHGKLNIVSSVGKGTELQVTLPLPNS